MQQGAQELAIHRLGRPSLPLEEQLAILALLVEIAVADEMENVILPAAQTLLQGEQGGRFQALHLHQAAALQIAQCFLQARPLDLGIQGRQAGWAGNAHQDAQRQLDLQRRGRLGQLQVAHHRRLHRQRQKAVQALVVQVLPGPAVQLSGVNAQAQAQSLAGSIHLVQAGRQAGVDLARKDRLEQPPAHLLGQLGLQAARPIEEILQLLEAEGRPELAPSLPGRRVEQARPVSAGLAIQQQIKILVCEI